MTIAPASTSRRFKTRLAVLAKTSVPLPSLYRLAVLALIFPSAVSVPPLTVTVRAAPRIEIEPVPMSNSLLPANVKSPFHAWVLLVARITAAPLLLAIVPPPMVKGPLPIALALLMLSCPALRTVPPL